MFLSFILPESITYLPLNTDDVMDRRIVFSLMFFLPDMNIIDIFWDEELIGFVYLEEHREAVEFVSVTPAGNYTTEQVWDASLATYVSSLHLHCHSIQFQGYKLIFFQLFSRLLF